MLLSSFFVVIFEKLHFSSKLCFETKKTIFKRKLISLEIEIQIFDRLLKEEKGI